MATMDVMASDAGAAAAAGCRLERSKRKVRGLLLFLGAPRRGPSVPPVVTMCCDMCGPRGIQRREHYGEEN